MLNSCFGVAQTSYFYCSIKENFVNQIHFQKGKVGSYFLRYNSAGLFGRPLSTQDNNFQSFDIVIYVAISMLSYQ